MGVAVEESCGESAGTGAIEAGRVKQVGVGGVAIEAGDVGADEIWIHLARNPVLPMGGFYYFSLEVGFDRLKIFLALIFGRF